MIDKAVDCAVKAETADARALERLIGYPNQEEEVEVVDDDSADVMLETDSCRLVRAELMLVSELSMDVSVE
jgi:hypothetical protein